MKYICFLPVIVGFVCFVNVNGDENKNVQGTSFSEQNKNLESKTDTGVVVDPIKDTKQVEIESNKKSVEISQSKETDKKILPQNENEEKLRDSKKIDIREKKEESLHKSKLTAPLSENESVEITPKIVFGSNSEGDLEKAVNVNGNNITSTTDLNKSFDEKMAEALKVINENVTAIFTGQPSNIDKIFLKLRKIFATEEFSNEEIFDFIDDATEIRKKYPLILECVSRIMFARKAIEHGIPSDKALQLSSSDYIQLPKFILNKTIKDYEFHQMISDVGCGIVWKDISKYLIAFNRYYGNNNAINFESFKNFPNKVQYYMRLTSEIAKFFQEYKRHIDYSIAQNFIMEGIDLKEVQSIFSLTYDELKTLCTPKNYENF